MRLGLIALLAICVLTGCGHHRGCAVHVQRASRMPNLVLGPDAVDTRAALTMAERADWPVAKAGYRFDDVSSYNNFSYDYIFGFDRFQGIYQGSESVDIGTYLR
jgi:hypothetical protein